MTPEQYVQDKAAKSGSSFYYAFLFLPPPRRAAITAFYAFCREVDDVVDEVADASLAATKLAWWRQEVASAFSGRPSHPVMQALLPLAQGTLAAAASKGLSAAVAGPVSRGDAGVIARHLAAFEALGPEHAALYREMTRRQLGLVQATQRLSDEQVRRVRGVL